jgi:rhodanese-related sulfurtransferase
MSTIQKRLGELDPARETVVICHHGVRSFHVARFLEGNGFSNVINLSGGVDAWAREVDRNMPTY